LSKKSLITAVLFLTSAWLILSPGCASKKKLGEAEVARLRQAYEDSLQRAREADRLALENQAREEKVEETVIEETPVPEKIEAPAVTFNEEQLFRNILFEFDKSDLSWEAREQLNEVAKYLKTLMQVKLTVEGHCDERASIEYNLALGEKRASSVKNYLTTLGIEAFRIETISYGEERPLDPRKNEDAYTKNRRAQFLVQK